MEKPAKDAEFFCSDNLLLQPIFWAAWEYDKFRAHRLKTLFYSRFPPRCADNFFPSRLSLSLSFPTSYFLERYFIAYIWETTDTDTHSSGLRLHFNVTVSKASRRPMRSAIWYFCAITSSAGPGFMPIRVINSVQNSRWMNYGAIIKLPGQAETAEWFSGSMNTLVLLLLFFRLPPISLPSKRIPI